MERTDYFIRRFLLVIPTFIGITLLCFALIQFVPGGPVEQAIMQMRSIGVSESGRGTGTAGTISPEQRKAIEAHFGFDKPFYQRYWQWLVKDVAVFTWDGRISDLAGRSVTSSNVSASLFSIFPSMGMKTPFCIFYFMPILKKRVV